MTFNTDWAEIHPALCDHQKGLPGIIPGLWAQRTKDDFKWL